MTASRKAPPSGRSLNGYWSLLLCRSLIRRICYTMIRCWEINSLPQFAVSRCCYWGLNFHWRRTVRSATSPVCTTLPSYGREILSTFSPLVAAFRFALRLICLLGLRAGRVFDSVPDWTRTFSPNSASFWAPDISFIDGEYRLYYAVSSFGKTYSAIGLAVNKTLDRNSADYKWADRGIVIQTPGGNDWNAIDPCRI